MRRLDTSAVTHVDDYQVQAVANEAIGLLQASPQWHSARKMRIDTLKTQAQRPAQQIAVLLRP
ncbi:hypothetical protein D3C71_2091590 [compost metagenome]